MRRRQAAYARSRLGAALVAGVSFMLAVAPAWADLFSYVQRPEPQARWERVSVEDKWGGQVAEYSLTSQVWKGELWTHTLRLYRPPKLGSPRFAVLYVGGGLNAWRGRPKKELFRHAENLGVILVSVDQVPNQPIWGMTEDDLIAHTFQEYLKTGDEEWPLLFPMAKAAVKAMDAAQDAARREWGVELGSFVVTGASKRGWTTWLAGAVDERVAGIAPMVYDNLNLVPQMRHQTEVWGAYSSEIEDYTKRGLQALLGTERGAKLAELVDPYTHKDRLARLPKLILVGTNDPYWPLDALNLYWDGLGGAKWVHYVANGGHEIGGLDRVFNARGSFVRRVASGRSLPTVKWEHGERDGRLRLTVVSDEAPAEVRLWSARSKTKSFSKASWKAAKARAEGGVWVAELERPDDGYVALLGEAEFRDGSGSFLLTTSVRIEPSASAASVGK